MALSSDHKPGMPEERRRIQACRRADRLQQRKAPPPHWPRAGAARLRASRFQNAGGFVEFGRVNGSLALSRALGDFVFKKNHG